MATKRIDGWAHKHSMRGEWFFDEVPHETKINGLQKPATMFISDTDNRPSWMTTDHVKAMLYKIRYQASIEPIGQFDIDTIAEMYGVTL